jgi:hypothetical protein
MTHILDFIQNVFDLVIYYETEWRSRGLFVKRLALCIGRNYENVQNRRSRGTTPIETYRKTAKAVLSTSSSL